MLGILLLGCGAGGDGEGGGGLSALFDALNGRYEVGGGKLPEDCFIEVLGSQIHAVDGAGARVCSASNDEGGTESVVVSATLSDSRLSGSGEYHEVRTLADLGCDYDIDRLISVTARADKTMGRSVDGRFAAIAGLWTGTVSAEGTVEVESSCNDPMRSADLITYQFDADIGGSIASITWTSTDGDEGTFDVTEDLGGNLDVDGSLVPFLP